ncbi:MAG: T9SS type A sorting domain-containing protein [Prevotella sp.]|nr:T9SS type A sorting domain-containing protein [Prevotella sp.]
MRKAVFFISLCTFALSASAQFKVQSDGYIAIQTTSTAQSPISINGAGSSSYYISCNTGDKSGINLSTYGSSTSSMIYGGNFSTFNSSLHAGLRGSASGGTNGFGVMGNADAPTKSIGLWGNISSSSTTGAGVYGTIGGDLGTYLTSGKYAGFFKGNVKVVGSITATSTLQGALLGESSSGSGSSANGLSLRSTSIASSLSGLNVTTYQKERPTPPENIETIYDLDGDTLQRGEKPELDIIDVQFYDKTHYALDADRLEETFPDLVYVNKDGSKVINYVEMIPLLVQSINELNAKIEVLEGQTSDGTARKARSTTDIQGSAASQNILYQNTPNPFREQTIIRFSLADDVQNAAICIFDMTGKTIKKMPISSGMESVSVGGYELGEGMFLYSLIVNGQEIDTKRMIISK